MTSDIVRDIASALAWVIMTPLGRPVDPLV
jgi:hypothetical protein